jgi:hypothetical protein
MQMICSKHYSGSYSGNNSRALVFQSKKIKKKLQLLVASSRGIQKLQSLILGFKRFSGWGLWRCVSNQKMRQQI